jgi:uncharacterized small protein (DUF1192 family)
LPGSDGQPENLATAVTEVSERMAVLVREEIELAKAEMLQKVSSIARGAAAIGAGAVFGVFAVVFILDTIAWGINDAIDSLWVGFAIVMVVLILLTVGAFLFARRALRVGPPTPQMAIDEAKKIRETVTTAPGRES